jgi:hypothetical protein
MALPIMPEMLLIGDSGKPDQAPIRYMQAIEIK